MTRWRRCPMGATVAEQRKCTVRTDNARCEACRALRRTNIGSTLFITGIIIGLVSEELTLCERHVEAFRRGTRGVSKKPSPSEGKDGPPR